MRIVHWQNILAIHQSAHIRALAAKPGIEVVWVVQDELTPDRKALGWPVPDAGKAQVVVAPTDQQIADLVHKAPADSVHILGGARWSHLGDVATRECIRAGARLGVMAEPCDARGLKGFFRRFKYIGDRFTTGRHFDFILTMGETGLRWYRQSGYPSRKVFPYAYITEAPSAQEHVSARPCHDVQILYLGRCIQGKGIEALAEALSGCASRCWRLTVVGDGPIRSTLQSRIQLLGISKQTSFTGAKRYPDAMSALHDTDILVLPSDGKEGWGAVVNEALMRGVPVICSSRCGAADLLLRAPWRGEVFPAGNTTALRQVLDHWITKGKRTPYERARLREWSRCITGEAAADYLLAILEHVYGGGTRPEAPWRKASRES